MTMEKSWMLPLEEKDRKRLKRSRLISLAFFIYLSLLLSASVGAFVYYVLIEGDVMGWWFGLIGAGVSVAVVIIYRNVRNIGLDLVGEEKLAVRGKINGKTAFRGKEALIVNGQSYLVSTEEYMSSKIGDEVLIAFGPMSKTKLDLHLIDKGHQ